MSTEPVIAGFSVTAILTAIVNLLVVFDVWSPSADQIAAVSAGVVIISSLIAALLVRAKVIPTAKL